MKLKEISSFLDSAIPLSFQESYDNCGLQVGSANSEIKSALITLDVTDDVVDEAISAGCGLIISHHPLIFGTVKKLTEASDTERIVVKCIRNEVSVYSAHTNLDFMSGGVSMKMAEKLGLVNTVVLSPLKKRLLKLVVYVPENYLEKVMDTVFEAGAGAIGNYDRCSFSHPGTGTFRAGEKAKPFVGKKGKIHFEREARFETILYEEMKNKVVDAMLAVHPYEEPAYDIYKLENETGYAGSGAVGELKEPMSKTKFLEFVSRIFSAKGIRYSDFQGKIISKVALCGGAGSFLLKDAMASGADSFITADIKYHGFFEAERRILLADIGHYESEKFAVEILYDLIIKKFPTFALRFSEINTNPINYL
jgi:dinuclear metal center YbgI/SA1388 family protein